MHGYQNRGKLTYEKFFKDYVVFSLVVKDKLLFILQKLMVLKLKTLKKMSKKIYHPRLVWPYFLLLCGPTGCGKTTWIVELLKSHEELCTHTPKKLIWIYGVEQPELFETIQRNLGPQVNVNLSKVFLKT